MRNRRLPDEIYNERWVKRIRSRCIVSASGCWLWQGQLTYNGYGQDQYRAKTKSLHRQMYKIVNGVDLNSKQYVCHHCDNRNCVNPDHMWIGTAKDNQQDMSRKGRAGFQSAKTCKRGHDLTGDNVYRAPSSGRRGCKLCQRRRMRIAAGWPVELAETLGVTPPGHRPVNARFHRKKRRTGAL